MLVLFWKLPMKIILLHGLYMHGTVMILLSHRLIKAGHHVLNLSYNSITPDLEKLFFSMDTFINKEEVAIVAHSMGGIFTRMYLESNNEMSQYVKMAITLGTPHKGSEVAAIFNKIGIAGFLFHSSRQFLLPQDEPHWPEGAMLYSLAGNKAIGAATLLLRGKASDGTVLLDETKINGMTSHEIFPLNHTALIFSKKISMRILEIIDLYSNELNMPFQRELPNCR